MHQAIEIQMEASEQKSVYSASGTERNNDYVFTA
jgi:hypothetical protein